MTAPSARASRVAFRVPSRIFVRSFTYMLYTTNEWQRKLCSTRATNILLACCAHRGLPRTVASHR